MKNKNIFLLLSLIASASAMACPTVSFTIQDNTSGYINCFSSNSSEANATPAFIVTAYQTQELQISPRVVGDDGCTGTTCTSKYCSSLAQVTYECVIQGHANFVLNASVAAGNAPQGTLYLDSPNQNIGAFCSNPQYPDPTAWAGWRSKDWVQVNPDATPIGISSKCQDGAPTFGNAPQPIFPSY